MRNPLTDDSRWTLTPAQMRAVGVYHMIAGPFPGPNRAAIAQAIALQSYRLELEETGNA